MHSVRRVKTTTEQQQARKKRDAAEITKFRKLEDALLKRDPSVPLEKAYEVTSSVLEMDSDHYTAWNIRRQLLEKSQASQSAENFQKLLGGELKFTEMLLSGNPKSYWIWNHRRWVLERVEGSSVWAREMALVGKLLERDARNFHGWGYRNWVVRSASKNSTGDEAPERDMFDFTTAKINHNFSNFSAWHYRAELMPHITDRPSLRRELDYVNQACAMDPANQSGWLYYEWLLNSGNVFDEQLTREVFDHERALIQELWDEEKSLWAARLLCRLNRQQGLPVDKALVERMSKLDPLRARRYESLI